MHRQFRPPESDEFCPNTEITFKVFYEGGFVSLSASNGAYITQAPYGFTGNYFYFKAKFADAIIRKVTKLLLESSFY